MFPACQALCLNIFLALSARLTTTLWNEYYLALFFKRGNWASTRLFPAQVHTAKSGKAELSVWVLNIKLYPSSLLSPIVCLLPAVESPLPTPKPGHLCLGIKIYIRDHNDEDILTIAKSPFLSMNRINEVGANEVQLNRKKKKKKTPVFKFWFSQFTAANYIIWAPVSSSVKKRMLPTSQHCHEAENEIIFTNGPSPVQGFPGSSLTKNPLAKCRTHGFDPWVRKIPWRRKWLPIPVFLPGMSHGQRSLVGYNPWGCKRVGPDWASPHASPLPGT